jgi:hypothetical protein
MDELILGLIFTGLMLVSLGAWGINAFKNHIEKRNSSKGSDGIMNRDKVDPFIPPVCAIVGGLAFMVAYLPAVFFKGCIYILLPFEFWSPIPPTYLAHYLGIDWGFICCSAPVVAFLLSGLGGYFTARRSTGSKNVWQRSIRAAIAIGAIYAFLPCGAFYPGLT